MNQNIESLLVERAGYERRGLPDRVKQVDAQLRELGFDHKYMSEPQIETASVEPMTERAIRKAVKKNQA